MGKGLNRTTALTLSAIMTVNLCTVGLATPAYAEEPAPVVATEKLSDIPTISKYILKLGTYSTRLKNDYSGETMFEFAFEPEDKKTGEQLMNDFVADQFLENAFIQINDGKIYSFEEAEIVRATYGQPSVTSFQTKNLDFIREFVDSDSFSIAIKDPEGNLVKTEDGGPTVSDNNTLSAEERQTFIEKYNVIKGAPVDKSELQAEIAKAEALKEAEYTPETYTEVQNALVRAKQANEDQTCIQSVVNKTKTDLQDAISKLKPAAVEGTEETQGLQIVAAGYIAEFSKYSETWGIKFSEDITSFVEDINAGKVASFEINGVKFEGKDGITKYFSTTYKSNQFYSAAGLAEDALKKTGKDNDPSIKITYVDGKVITFGTPATETQPTETPTVTPEVPKTEGGQTDPAQPETTTPTTTPETVVPTDPKAQPSVATDSFNFVTPQLVKYKHYNEPSMSGATMQDKGYFLKNSDGSGLLVLHFHPAVINGIKAYATGLTLENQISNQFILADDNSGVCLIGVPAFEGMEATFDGHVYSSVMDADVSLKVSGINQVSDINKALSDKVKECESLLSQGTYYKKTVKNLEKAIKAAKGNPSNPAQAYADLVVAQTNLREEVEDPFVGDKFFFLSAQDTSVVGSRLLAPQVRVDVDAAGKKTVTGVYNTSLEWYGLSSISNVKVYADGARTQEIPVTLKKLHDGRLEFKFTVDSIPSSGVFKTKIEEMKGNVPGRAPINSDLQLDYATLRKGPQKPLLQAAIKEANTYLADDFSTLLPLSDKKDDFTESSWNEYEEVIHNCTEDLKLDLTQEQIDANIAKVKEARSKLLYKSKAGFGSTANNKATAFNNPVNYYGNGGEFENRANHVGWSGSKILFGNEGKVYRVLNNGKEIKDGKLTDSGKILIMAEDDMAKVQFTDVNPEQDLTKMVRWDKSKVREYLNGEFLNSKYTSAQRAAIVETDLTTKFFHGPYDEFVIEDIQTKDKLFAPSVEMLKSYSNGYASSDARGLGSEYGLRNITKDALGNITIMAVMPKGNINSSFLPHSVNYQTLPSMNLDADRILMTVDAKTGLPDTVKPATKLETNLWKLVLKNDSLATSNPQAKRTGNEVKLSADTNADGLAVVVVDGDDVQIGKILAAGKVVNGKFTLPEKFDEKTQKVFVLGINETKSGYESSNPVLIPADQLVSVEEEKTETVDPQKPAAANTVSVRMMKDGETSKRSMADDMFAAKADVVPNGDSVTLKLYVAYPIPKFKDQGLNGTILSPSIDYKGKNYKGEIDITSKPLMEVKRRNVTFGLNKGDQIPAEVISFTLPKEALKEKFLKVHGYVNVVMNDNVTFDMYLSDVDVDLSGKTSGSTTTPATGTTTPSTGSTTTPSTGSTTRPATGTTPSTGGSYIPTTPSVTKPSKQKGGRTYFASLSSLPNGVYEVPGVMYKANKSGTSMANKALDSDVEVTVENGNYYATLSFHGIDVGGTMGYLGGIKYLDDSGNLVDAEVLDTITVDGVTYPSTVRIKLNSDAVQNGWQGLQVFVQAMEDISEGSGTQDVYLKIDTQVQVTEAPDGSVSTGKNAGYSKGSGTSAGSGSSKGSGNSGKSGAATPAGPAKGSSSSKFGAPRAGKSGSSASGSSASGSGASASKFMSLAGLPNGEYSVLGDMYKANKSGESMANKALDHNIKITVEDGVYYATLNFRGIKVGAKMGYLGGIKYLDNSGALRDAEVLETITVDGVTYPQVVRIQLNNEAINTGWQSLQVFVQAMEDIAAGSGTQDVYLKINPDGVSEGYDAGKSFFGTIAQTQSQRTAATGDSTMFGAISAFVIAGLGALGFKKRREQ